MRGSSGAAEEDVLVRLRRTILEKELAATRKAASAVTAHHSPRTVRVRAPEKKVVSFRHHA